ncbi:MAG: DNA topoisomerase 3 [Mitsuokella sp.]|uniref:DNA topoisomerase 3 n=1 Tax=Mitsuokella sp. TaxID=2049034 RepID=UPI003F11E7E9
MRLFIAEKPSLARAIAENLGKQQKKDGCIVLNQGQDVVTWCFGHIMDDYNPEDYDESYKKWRFDTLPIIPNTWKLRVRSDAKKQFNIIKDLVKKADTIVNAGDPDREGQLLVDEVLTFLGNKKPVQRILLNALDSKSVKEALNDLRDNRDFEGLRDSAEARRQADWLVGMNLTRAYSMKRQAAGYDGTVHVGRVKTPTLALIVRREDELKNFKPTTHYIAKVIWKHENGAIPTLWKIKEDQEGLDSEGRLLKKEVAEGLLEKMEAAANHSDGAQIASVEQKKKQENQRLPYSLSTLQVEAGRKYGYSPKQVLDTMQSLYEKKLTTYPRSDCEYLPENQYADAKQVLNNLKNIPDKDFQTLLEKADTSIKSRCWNDKKISAHHALIPTTEKLSFNSLSEAEQRMYLLVSKAYLAQFFPLHTYLATKIIVTCADETFVANGKTVTDLGWKAIYQKDKSDKEEEDESSLPTVVEGDTVTYQEGSVQEKVTTPPKRFTTSSLLQAMKEIYKYVQDKELVTKLKSCKGIGTEATRAGIIDEITKDGSVKVEKGKLVPTESGAMAIHLLPDEITYPDLTARWENELDEVADGSLSLDIFRDHQISRIIELIDKAKNLNIKPNANVPLCPNCGKPLRRRKGAKGIFWGCSGYPNCKTTFPDKNGKPDLNAKKAKSVPPETCPKCGKKLYQRHGKFGTFWACEDRDNCGAHFPDKDNKPVIVLCPECKKGYLLRAESKKKKGSYFWYCSERCGAKSVWDKNGLPDLKK